MYAQVPPFGPMIQALGHIPFGPMIQALGHPFGPMIQALGHIPFGPMMQALGHKGTQQQTRCTTVTAATGGQLF